MENTPKAYSMILGRPWLKLWGNNILIIIANTKTMTLSINKRIMVHPSQRPCNLDDIYDSEGGSTNGDEKHLYHVVPKLWPIGKISPKEFKFLPKIYEGMVQPEKNIIYPFWYYHHKLGETLILDKLTNL
jgi:hypothetical protein